MIMAQLSDAEINSSSEVACHSVTYRVPAGSAVASGIEVAESMETGMTSGSAA